MDYKDLKMVQDFTQPTTLIELLRQRVRNQPNKKAYTFLKDGETEEANLTYAQLDQRAQVIAAKLQSMVAARERVLLLYPSGLDYITAFLGCLYADMIAVPAYPPRRNRSDQRLAAIAADAKAAVVLTTTDILSKTTQQLTHAHELKNLRWIATDNLAEALADNWQMPKIESDTLAFLQYTSGSTGTPKGVMVTHSNILYNSKDIDLGWGHTQDSVMVTWLPIFHDMGLIYGILQPLYKGFSCYLMTSAAFLQKPFRWLQTISRFCGTHSAAPNFAYELCVQRITPQQRTLLDLSHWQMALNGSEPIRKESLQRFADTFESCGFNPKALCPGYGLAEATLKVSAIRSDKLNFMTLQSEALAQHKIIKASQEEANNPALSHTIVGCGFSEIDTQVVIVNQETLMPCASDEVGEIWVSGASIAQGYWNRSNETKYTFHAFMQNGEGPFMRTGDLGFLQDEELFVMGRVKDVIIIRGENYYPQDIELTVENSHIALHPSGSAAFSVEIAGEERLVIAQEVKRTAFRKLNVDEVISAIRQAVAEQYELVVYAVLLLRQATIPKTSSGKIQRQACKTGFLENTFKTIVVWQQPEISEQYQETVIKKQETASQKQTPLQHLKQVAPNDRYALILSTIRKILSTITGLSKIGNNDNLIESGMDSFAGVEFLDYLEETYEMSLSTTFLRDYPTLHKISGYLELKLWPTTDTNTELKLVAEDEMAVSVKELADFSYRFASELKGRRAKIDGQWYIDYGSCNYLGLDWHPYVMEAVQPALARWGVHPPWTRFLASPQIYQELEIKLAKLVAAPYVDVFPTVTLLNMGLMPELIGPEDILFIDQYAHSCLQKAAALCHERGSRIVVFRHNDVADLEQRMATVSPSCKKLIVVDGVYSLDGTHAPLPGLVELGKRYNALIMIDDSHGFGVLGEQPTPEFPYGKRGNGIAKYYDLDYGRDGIIYVGQLSKAYSTMGGFVAYGDITIQTAVRNAFSMIFSGPLPTASLATGIAGLEVNEREGDKTRTTILERTRLLIRGLQELGYTISSPPDSHLIRVTVGTQPTSVEFLKKLMVDEKIIVTPAVYPAVEWTNTGFRFMVTALHTEEDIAETLVSMKKLVNIVQNNND
ncbi:aminotransferase class I/II-fold pyridoxal phosphate-dependent enzyme [Candidatus Parabeggiatoa sp. HSG14]|uniref:aminotransferase class I/II-fold pyridoxal phosphate-dependent enzyme n=1 Tax=Candidatus Parabeggiatoa sp. HSG14 TaxID=3055593 RepID=UPI0025A74861|nr:aminotransferase class I/II-fold pyridoxal phosphate-dependent enzyme [Thiotrichales bacterium HSG14]